MSPQAFIDQTREVTVVLLVLLALFTCFSASLNCWSCTAGVLNFRTHSSVLSYCIILYNILLCLHEHSRIKQEIKKKTRDFYTFFSKLKA